MVGKTTAEAFRERLEQEYSKLDDYTKLTNSLWASESIIDRCFRQIKTGEFEKDAKFLEEMFWTIDIDDIQKDILKLKDYEKEKFGDINPTTLNYIKEFGDRYNEVCSYIVSLKLRGQE